MPLSDLEYEFLEGVLTDVDTVGKQTAARIISTQHDFEAFQSLSRKELSTIPRLGDEPQRTIFETVSAIDFTQDVRVLYIDRIISEFLRRQYTNITNIRLADLDINVLLVKALGFRTAEELIEFYLYQRVTRSVVTSWGSSTVENLCKVAGATDIPRNENVSVGGKAFDLRTEHDGKTYYIQVKSGPNTMNVGMVDSLNRMIDRIEATHDDAVGVLGMTYGRESQISTQIQNNLTDFDDKALIGSEFWAFLSGEERYYVNLIEELDRVSHRLETAFDRTFTEVIAAKQAELETQWASQYGGTDADALERFLTEYTA